MTNANAAALEELQQKFPNGAYWNHKVTSGHYYSNYSDVGSCNNPDGYSWTPCYSHSANAPIGYYDCNSFNGGLQCCGFARKLAYDAYGSYATNWTNYTYDSANTYMWNSLKPGDVLHYTGGNADATYGHWVFVTAVNGNAITVGECNVNNSPCQIRWGNVIYKDNIYAVRVCVAPSALNTSSSSVITWTDAQADPSETDAYLFIKANAPYNGSWGDVGIVVWDAAGKVVAQKSEKAASNATNYLNVWYNLTEETGAVLARNATYTYRFYVYFNGTYYESDVGTFTTDPCATHTIVTVPGEAASCSKPGKTEGKKCSVCGVVTIAQQEIAIKDHSFKNGTCGTCGAADPNYIAPVSGVNRVAGDNRYSTGLKVADQLKTYKGTSKFNAIVVASGREFPDALAGSYLANQKGAPILLVNSKSTSSFEDAKNYIAANLATGGTVYILGGEAAVPKQMADILAGYNVKRLAGANRYDTNLEILKEAGTAGQEILICTGKGFADSLSASAANKPILLLSNKSITAAQRAFLENSSKKFIIIGGESAISAQMEAELEKIGTVVDRLAGANRYETSVKVANYFFRNPTTAVVAYAKNFPDGLCGGPLAKALNAPLILTAAKAETLASDYMKANNIKDGLVLGGTSALSENTVSKVFGE